MTELFSAKSEKPIFISHILENIKFYFIQGHEILQNQTVERAKSTYRLPLKKIVVSNWLLDIMDKEYCDKEVSLVPNSVDLEIFYATKRGKQTFPTVGFMYSPAYLPISI